MIAWLALAAAQVPATCGGCHPVEHAAWADSRHAHAFDVPAFQDAWRNFPDPWCTTCHDRDDGVGCADCHVDGGLVRTARIPSDRAWDAHPMIVADLGVGVCAECHQFSAPGGGGVMQDTLAEYVASGASEACSDCHGAHAVAGARDRDFVGRAVAATYADGVVHLEAHGVGHQVPTGDPWRRFVVELLDGDVVVRRYVVGRQVAGVGPDLHTVADHRLPVPVGGVTARDVVVDPSGAGAWRVVFSLTDPDHPGTDPAWVLAEGALRN